MLSRKQGIVRSLPASDPRNPSHPQQRENWLKMAKELGRAWMAAQLDEGEHFEEGSNLRAV